MFKNVQRSERMQRKKDDIGRCVEKEAKKKYALNVQSHQTCSRMNVVVCRCRLRQ